MNEVELGFPAMTFEAGLSHRKMVRMHGPSGNVRGGEGNKYQRRHRLNDLSVADGTTVTHSNRFTCMLGPHAI